MFHYIHEHLSIDLCEIFLVTLTHNAPTVAVLLPSSLDAFVAEAAIESTRDQRETSGCKIYMFQKLEILPVVPDFYFICMEI